MRRVRRRRNGQIAQGVRLADAPGYHGIEAQVIDIIAGWLDAHR